MIAISPIRLGQVSSRTGILADAVTEALALYRLQTFPMNPENPWKVSAASFKKLVSRTSQSAVGYSSQEIAAAIVARGYTTSDLSPYAQARPVAPAPQLPPIIQLPVAPVIQLPAAPPSASVRTVTVAIPGTQPIPVPLPPPIPLPEPQPVLTAPVVPMPELEPGGKAGWLVAAGLVAIMLS